MQGSHRDGMTGEPTTESIHSRKPVLMRSSRAEAIVDNADVLRIPVGPGALHVDRYGRGGPPVVLLHGFATSSFLWRMVGPALAHAGCTAFAMDLFGHGESDRPYDADYGIAAQAEYIDRAMTALRISTAVVAGVDLGGAVALRLAATRPERVRRLVLCNPIAFDDVPAEDVKCVQRNTARYAIRLNRSVLGAAPLIEPVLQDSVSDKERMPDRLVGRYVAPFVGRDGVDHLLAIARSIDAEDLEDIDLSEVRTRTVIVWGENDKWVDARLPQRLAQALPAAQLVRYANVGRLTPEEIPEEIVRILAAAAWDRQIPLGQ